MALLEVRGLTVRFGGNLAVDDVDLDADAGTIRGLIGPNGAGKTTTFNLICGVLTPTGGRVAVDNHEINRLSTHKRARLGIGRTFQRLEVFGSMTARENIQVGAEIRQGWGRSNKVGPPLLSDDPKISLADEVELLIDRLGLSTVADVRVGELPTGQARLVELGRALAIRPRLLLLDEPASGLDDAETHDFGTLLKELATAGLGVLLVEHDVSLVMDVCHRVTVLNLGQVIEEGTPAEVQQSTAVIDAYLGSSI
jgi:branched-chain amino acid transport system ATP-binding protein